MDLRDGELNSKMDYNKILSKDEKVLWEVSNYECVTRRNKKEFPKKIKHYKEFWLLTNRRWIEVLSYSYQNEEIYKISRTVECNKANGIIVRYGAVIGGEVDIHLIFPNDEFLCKMEHFIIGHLESLTDPNYIKIMDILKRIINIKEEKTEKDWKYIKYYR